MSVNVFREYTYRLTQKQSVSTGYLDILKLTQTEA